MATCLNQQRGRLSTDGCMCTGNILLPNIWAFPKSIRHWNAMEWIYVDRIHQGTQCIIDVWNLMHIENLGMIFIDVFANGYITIKSKYQISHCYVTWKLWSQFHGVRNAANISKLCSPRCSKYRQNFENRPRDGEIMYFNVVLFWAKFTVTDGPLIIP